MLFNGETGVIQAMTDTEVVIQFSKKDACDSCGLKVVCAPGKESERSLTLPYSGEFSIGQPVQIQEMSNLELHLSLVQFGLPMLAFLVGMILVYMVSGDSQIPREFLAFLGGLIGLAISYFGAKKLVQNIVDTIPEKYLRVVPYE